MLPHISERTMASYVLQIIDSIRAISSAGGPSRGSGKIFFPEEKISKGQCRKVFYAA